MSGKIDFIEGSALDFKEFIEKTEGVEKYKYGYNYRKDSDLLFRYDNANDPAARHLDSFPHHKHTKDGNIVCSHPVTLSEVLEEVWQHISANWNY